jgi:beta-phosphoglucomutase-like phosphatase (HAD superfamily)
LGVDAARCAVVEDTTTGVRAGVAAGATVFAYAPLGNGQPLLDAGALRVFGGMAELRDVLR